MIDKLHETIILQHQPNIEKLLILLAYVVKQMNIKYNNMINQKINLTAPWLISEVNLDTRQVKSFFFQFITKI